MRTHCAILVNLVLALVASVGQLRALEETTSERMVEFRDGSILRMQIPSNYSFQFRVVDRDAGQTLPPSEYRLSNLKHLRFSQFPALKQLQVIKAAVEVLDDENFEVREKALQQIVTGGNGFRPFLKDMLEKVANPESRWRLANALSLLPEQAGIYEHAYDQILTDDGEHRGEIDTWEIDVEYRGRKLTLKREHVRSIRIPPDKEAGIGTPIIATTERIPKDQDAFFPGDCMRIDFENDSRGDPLRPGQDLTRRFIPDGVVITTSEPDSFFSVNDFALNSRSGKQSGATHDPLFLGVITLTFCVPGNELDPAGVTHVGFSVGIVQEGGTTLAAFDASGHQIASVTTLSDGTEFLGLRSDVPIHEVRIIPNVGIDPDITIDDLVFSVPELLDSGGAASHLTLDFTGGERLVCNDFRLQEKQLSAVPASHFSEEIAIPRDHLRQIRTPAESQENLLADRGEKRFWIMLDDGSTMLAKAQRANPPATVFENVPLSELGLTAIWGETTDRSPLPADFEIPEGELAVINSDAPELMKEPQFTQSQFKASSGDSVIEWSFERLPTIWMAKPNTSASQRASGFIRLNTGERIVLGEGSTFKLLSFDSKNVRLSAGDRESEVPLNTITTIRLPKATR